MIPLSVLSFRLLSLRILPLTPCSPSTGQYFPDPEPLTTPYHAELLCSLKTVSGLGVSVARDDPCKHHPFLVPFDLVNSHRVCLAPVSRLSPPHLHHLPPLFIPSSSPLLSVCLAFSHTRPVTTPTRTRSSLWSPPFIPPSYSSGSDCTSHRAFPSEGGSLCPSV